MPEYATHCDACGHDQDVVHAMAARHPACSKCGGETRTDWRRQNAPGSPAHDLHGTREMCQDVQMQRREVPEARRLFGSAGACIQDDGTVRFRHRSEADAFFSKENALKKQFAEQRGEGKLKDKPKPIRDGKGRVVAPAKVRVPKGAGK